MVEDERRQAPDGRRRMAQAALERAERNRLVEIELDRWMEHRRELQRRRRRRAAWNDAGVEGSSPIADG